MKYIWSIALGITLTVIGATTAQAQLSTMAEASVPNTMTTLNYKKENRWVAKEDAASLRSLIKTSKEHGVRHFFVALPEENRKLAVGRLIVLRDILERQLKQEILIEEIEAVASKNQIDVWLTKPVSKVMEVEEDMTSYEDQSSDNSSSDMAKMTETMMGN